MIDLTNLETKLSTLTGLDFEEVEKEERLAGNFAPDISFSKSFQTRIAARALGINPHDIKELPINQYNNVAQRVMNFLFRSSDFTETATDNSDQETP